MQPLATSFTVPQGPSVLQLRQYLISLYRRKLPHSISLHYMPPLLSLHLLADGPLTCSQLLALMNKAAVNT